jgi:hypothetical protein
LPEIRPRPAHSVQFSMYDETLEQVSQFTYLGCSISYQFSNDVEFKSAKFLQLIGTIKRTVFKKVRTETILKLYNTLVLTCICLWRSISIKNFTHYELE